jgi:hypothetical protein
MAAALCSPIDSKAYLSIATDTTGALIADVLEYRLEGAFVAGPVEHPQLTSLPVCKEELAIYAPRAIQDVFHFIKTKTPKVLVSAADVLTGKA